MQPRLKMAATPSGGKLVSKTEEGNTRVIPIHGSELKLCGQKSFSRKPLTPQKLLEDFDWKKLKKKKKAYAKGLIFLKTTFGLNLDFDF